MPAAVASSHKLQVKFAELFFDVAVRELPNTRCGLNKIINGITLRDRNAKVVIDPRESAID